MRGFPGREDHRRSSRGKAKNGGSCRWFRRPITPSHKKKNGLITPRIIHLLGSFIGKNGLIIGNRFTALQRQPRGHPSIRSIFLVSLPLPLRSITNDGNRVGWQPNWFSSSSFLYADNGGPAISTENNILRQVTPKVGRSSFLFFHEHACFSTVIIPVGYRRVLCVNSSSIATERFDA